MNILVHEHGPSYLFSQTQEVVYAITTSIVRKKKKKKKIKYNTITSDLVVYKHQFLIINARVTERLLFALNVLVKSPNSIYIICQFTTFKMMCTCLSQK